MSKVLTTGARLAGVSSCVPAKVFDNQQDTTGFDPDEIKKVVAMAGIRQRKVADDSICSSDLCLKAAKNLLEDLQWEPSSIDALVMVTQTPDYFLPSSACLIHRDLGLSDHCASFDVGLGCSGYPYGLWLGAMMIQTGSAKRALILHGETPSRFTHPDDRATYLLFGDAGSATAIEASSSNEQWGFCLHSDGSGYSDLIIEGGGFRNRSPENDRDHFLNMHGANLFNFTVKRVPTLINDTLELTEKAVADVDAFIFHQSNKFIMHHIAKKCALPTAKVPIILDRFGNSGGPSVPLTLTQTYLDKQITEPQTLMLLGYGVGLSWSSALLQLHSDIRLNHCEL